MGEEKKRYTSEEMLEAASNCETVEVADQFYSTELDRAAAMLRQAAESEKDVARLYFDNKTLREQRDSLNARVAELESYKKRANEEIGTAWKAEADAKSKLEDSEIECDRLRNKISEILTMAKDRIASFSCDSCRAYAKKRGEGTDCEMGEGCELLTMKDFVKVLEEPKQDILGGEPKITVSAKVFVDGNLHTSADFGSIDNVVSQLRMIERNCQKDGKVVFRECVNWSNNDHCAKTKEWWDGKVRQEVVRLSK